MRITNDEDDSLRRWASEMDGDMIARNLSPRLKRLEAELTPKRPRVLAIIVTRVGADSRPAEHANLGHVPGQIRGIKR